MTHFKCSNIDNSNSTKNEIAPSGTKPSNCVCTHCGIHSGLHMSNVCSKHVKSALRSNYIINSASNRYFIGTDTNQSKG